MTITYGRLCELAQEHGFEMNEKLRELLRGVEAEALGFDFHAILRKIEGSHTGMLYGDEKHGSVTEYTRGFGACLDAVKRALARATTATESAYTDSTPQLHVGNSSFEGWYADYAAKLTGNPKQTARDAYAAGMGDPLVVAREAVQPEAHPNIINELRRARDGWQEEAESMMRSLKQAQAHIDLMHKHQTKDVWYFQGDGADNIESMGHNMVVVIHAGDLRGLISPEPVAASVTGDSARLEWLLSNRAELRLTISLEYMVSIGKWAMGCHRDPREAIDRAMRSTFTPPKGAAR